MPTLREFQESFVDSLFAGGEPDEVLARHIEANGLSAARRLGIYRNNLLASLTEALGDTYPAFRALVGEDFFHMLARRYIHEHPSGSGDLHAFGEHFESFLAGLEEAATMPWMPDLARLEWCYHQVFHAADASPLDVSALARFEQADHDRLVLHLHPATAPVSSRYPLTAIWRLGVHGDEHSDNVDIDAGPEYLLVARRDLEMIFQLLTRGEHAFVEAMSAGRPLVDCAEAAFAVDDDFDLGEALARQFVMGNITGAEPTGRGPSRPSGENQ